ncbi:Plastid-lipid associated protein PAP / fibrillin family protein [Arabidopsis thaliana]|nr:Plastid-lipid associated protein PAP / fibrillin family protein [Arabidopsis thaliana]AEC10078.1 Plastid-lipid associated protein PAP / fibrillin family protein [Arabidopsis thaliana]|eukprot:NP_973665.1 Plastid-lipid associated protein PAP / fibrillin family protein [Arabidopsis thaliana]
MALIHGSVPGTSAVRLVFSTSASPSRFCLNVPVVKQGWKNSCRRRVLRAMVQETVQGSPLVYAREMERLSAKESLLLALKDAGGFEALVTGKTTNMQRIDVNERITSLERLNPTPRPTTSPCFEGRWNFEWFGSGSPGLLAARVIFERFPSTLANLSRMEILIKDANAKATANIKLLNSIESKIILSSKLTVEGPLRLKEEYVEGMLETPTVIEEAVPEQLKSALGQAATTLQQLPALIKDTLASGLRIPLSGSFERFFMISYLDEEIL